MGVERPQLVERHAGGAGTADVGPRALEGDADAAQRVLVIVDDEDAPCLLYTSDAADE